MTYAESRGHAPFNWFQRLTELAAGAELTPGEHRHLIELAKEWPTCACGCQDVEIERDPEDAEFPGAPIDRGLRTLGHSFYYLVEHEYWSPALATWNAIEARAGEIIAGKHGINS